jgi:hypothetical protein
VADANTAEQLASIVIRGLAAGEPVEIDGLGTFYLDSVRGFVFEPRACPRVFVAYAREDLETAERLYDELAAAGFSPWMDTRKLAPGQNWPRSIENAIDSSDFFLACFSRRSASKRGGFQAEIRYALDCARRVPLEEIFIVPVRLDDCRVPRQIQKELQYIDLFPNWLAGVCRLISTLRRELERRIR